jgi:acetyltransferase EpsM
LLNTHTAILIPLLNPNEPEALLTAVHVVEGQHVAISEPLCTLETTKSTAELPAEQEGFVIGLRLTQGQTVRAGELLCYLAEDPAWKPPTETALPQADAQSGETARETATLPVGLRITQPAQALARQIGLNFDLLPLDRLVTESVVRETLASQASKLEYIAPTSAFDPTAILVYGGGGHGKSLIDLLRILGIFHIVGIIDDGISPGERIMGLLVLGGAEVLADLYAQGVRLAVNAVGGIGNVSIRLKVFQHLAQAGFACPPVIHPTAFVEVSSALSPGVQVMPHAYVGSEARLGFGVIVNTGAIVSHDCALGDYVNISPGAMLAGEVHIGRGALVGMGATLHLGVKVGAGARIGNGATIKADVPDQGVVKAGTIWPI